MECPSDEKMVSFVIDELREEMSRDVVGAIEAHISQCAKCQKEKENFLKLVGKIAEAGKEMKRSAPSTKKGNGEGLMCADEKEKIALLKELLNRKEDKR